MPRKKQPTDEQIEQAFILAAMYPSGDSRWGKHAKRLIDTDSIVLIEGRDYEHAERLIVSHRIRHACERFGLRISCKRRTTRGKAGIVVLVTER
jgi:hypothetical protein